MKIADVLNAITDFILHFDPKKYTNQIKIVIFAVALIGAFLIFISGFLSHI